MLNAHRLAQIEEHHKAGDKWIDKNLVFCGLLGDFFNPNYLLRIFKKVLKDAGLPHMRFHDVRRFDDCKIALKGQKVRAITF